MTGWAGSRGGLEGESSSSRAFLNFWDDFRGGGLGGGGESLFFFFLSFLSPPRTVPFDDDDEDVRDSLIAARVCGLASALIPPISLGPSWEKLPDLPRAPGLILGPGVRMGATRPGE